MSTGWLSWSTGRRSGIVLVVGCAMALLSASAQAVGLGSDGSSTVNRSGTYNGHISQRVPRQFAGHIHFVVAGGKVTGLSFTAGALCGVLWVVDKDHSLPSVSVRLNPEGAFFYKGTIGGRLIELKGTISGTRATGTFFQAFPWGQLTCTMGQAASFTATR